MIKKTKLAFYEIKSSLGKRIQKVPIPEVF